jgi:hypothetical protein
MEVAGRMCRMLDTKERGMEGGKSMGVLSLFISEGGALLACGLCMVDQVEVGRKGF